MSKVVDMSIRVIERAERLNSSVNGNPAWRVFFTDGSSARTKSDASCGYEIANLTHSRHRGSEVVVTWTRAGRIETITLRD